MCQFKEMPKASGIDSSFYRQGLGFSGYPGYSPGLLHPTFAPSTPFAPPTHLPTFTPKVRFNQMLSLILICSLLYFYILTLL